MSLKVGDYILFSETYIIGRETLAIKKDERYKVEEIDFFDARIFYVYTEDRFPWYLSQRREGIDFKLTTKYILENFL